MRCVQCAIKSYKIYGVKKNKQSYNHLFFTGSLSHNPGVQYNFSIV